MAVSHDGVGSAENIERVVAVRRGTRVCVRRGCDEYEE